MVYRIQDGRVKKYIKGNQWYKELYADKNAIGRYT